MADRFYLEDLCGDLLPFEQILELGSCKSTALWLSFEWSHTGISMRDPGNEVETSINTHLILWTNSSFFSSMVV